MIDDERPLNQAELGALRAIADGREPAEELLRARLKRRGLVTRGILGDHRLALTPTGHRILEANK